MARRTRHRHPSASASVIARPGAAMAAHDAASGTDLAMRDWNPVAGSADADLLPDLDTLTARSRDLGRNNGLMAGGMQTLRDNIVVSGCLSHLVSRAGVFR